MHDAGTRSSRGFRRAQCSSTVYLPSSLPTSPYSHKWTGLLYRRGALRYVRLLYSVIWYRRPKVLQGTYCFILLIKLFDQALEPLPVEPSFPLSKILNIFFLDLLSSTYLNPHYSSPQPQPATSSSILILMISSSSSLSSLSSYTPALSPPQGLLGALQRPGYPFEPDVHDRSYVVASNPNCPIWLPLPLLQLL